MSGVTLEATRHYGPIVAPYQPAVPRSLCR